jgi:hypothetical protein
MHNEELNNLYSLQGNIIVSNDGEYGGQGTLHAKKL